MAEADAVWETLIRTGVADRVVPERTLTPGDYEAANDEVSLTTSLPIRSLTNLPVMRVAVPGQEAGSADLELGELLGKGGMGTVHLAWQNSLERDVAVKRLLGTDPKMVQALLREAALAGTLEHPNIVPIHALGQDEMGQPVLVMKRIEGSRWSELLKDPAQDLDRHLSILADVCNAVHYAHSKGIVHRDIKPGNVMIGEFGEVVLVDWGVAARFDDPAPGVAYGTPGYMAPEMAYGEIVDARTDVFLLGATLHKILTGLSRNHGSNGMAAMMKATKAEPATYDDSVPEELGKICNRACSRKRIRRFPTAQSFRDALVDFRRHRLSLQFGITASTRYAEMKALAAAEDPDPVSIVELGTITCYAFQQALDEWDGNAIARSELQSCLETLIPWQLQARDWERASASLDSLRSLTGRAFADLGATVESERRRARALEKLGKELDLSVHSGWRVAFLMSFALIATLYGTVIVGIVRLGYIEDGHVLSLFASGTSLVGVALVLMLFRQLLLRTLVNQRIMYTLLAAFGAVFFHRVIAWGLELEIQSVYPVDMLFLTLGSCVAGISVDLRFLWLAGGLAVGTIIAAIFPEWSLEVLSFSIASTGLSMALLFARWLR